MYCAYGAVCAVLFLQLIRSVVGDLYGHRREATAQQNPTACLDDVERLYAQISARAVQPAPGGLEGGALAREWDAWARRWEDDLDSVSQRCRLDSSGDAAARALSDALDGIEELRRLLSRSGADGAGPVPDLLIRLAEQQPRVLRRLGTAGALEERLQRVERALVLLGLDARAAQVVPDHAVVHLGLELDVAPEVLGSRFPVLPPEGRLPRAARGLCQLPLHARGAIVDGPGLQGGHLAAVEVHRLRHRLVEAGAFLLAGEQLVDPERLVGRLAPRLVGGLDPLRVLLQRGGARLVGLRVAASGANFGVRVGDGAGAGDDGEADVGSDTGHPMTLLLLFMLAPHLLELGMEVLQQVVGLDDQVSRLDQFLAQRGEVAVAAGGFHMRGHAAGRAGLIGHRHLAPERLGSGGASHGGDFGARVFCALLLWGGRLSFVIRLEEMEHQADREQVAADVEALLALGVDLRAGQRVPFLDHRCERAGDLQAQSEGDVSGRRVRLVVDAGARTGVQRVPDATAPVEREAPTLHQGSIQREQDRNAPDLEVATRDAVAVGEVSELDLEVQLFVVLVPEGDHPAGLHQPVRSALLGQVRGVARNERAGAAGQGDAPFAFLRDRGSGGRGGQERCQGETHLR